ncbi:MAG TPA: ATP-binding protein [Candidatus Saccharimonadales bacterium]|nr:ATP-binding protein [Candidatus Saccharimonadales bacterium]
MDDPTQLTRESLSAVLREQFEAFRTKDTGTEREILADLEKTVKSPLVTVISGLRRVGKSTLLAQIAHKYLSEDFYFINFEDERLLNFRTQDFDLLHETLISLYGERRTFLFDEIQNIPEWERFVRRLHDQGYKFIVTGSNASLLSQELGTRLTGRSTRVELFPFSFREFLLFKNIHIPKTSQPLTTLERGRMLKLMDEYLAKGGIPDSLKYPDLPIHKTLYDDVLYRDIAARYQLENVKSLKELAFYLVSNPTSLISFNKLKELLKLGSVNTVKSYIDYLENSWLFFVLNKYAYSVKEQQIAAKKIYSIDTGLIRSVAFAFSENKGKAMENAAFLQLRRTAGDFYYFKTSFGREVDFFLPATKTFVQVTLQLDSEDTREREVRALLEASSEYEGATLLILTENEKNSIIVDGLTIDVLPLYEWLLTAN